MKDKVFLDTNIFVYLYSEDSKGTIVKNLIDSEFDNLLLSTQVLNELINVLAYKLKVKTKKETKEIIQNLLNSFDVSTLTSKMIIRAIDVSMKYKYSYFDSLMISCALEKGCKILYSEDMQDNQLIENTLTIVNPFKH